MTNNDYLIVIDLGTTEIKGVLFSPSEIINSKRRECSLSFPKKACVEQDPKEIKNLIYTITKELVDSNKDIVKNIKGITFTSQMQNTLALDKKGEPLMNILSWMDQRAQNFAKDVIWSGSNLFRIHGFPILKLLKYLKITNGAPGFNGKDTVAKLGYIKQNMPDIYMKVHKFLDIKDYAIFLATGKYITSPDMAGITWLMDVRQGDFKWSEEIHNMYDLDPQKMPELMKSTSIAGNITQEFSKATGLSQEIKVITGAGDLLTAAIGSGAIEDGKIILNVGTSGYVGTHHPISSTDTQHYTGTIISGIPKKYFVISKQETLGGSLEWFKNLIGTDSYAEIDNYVQNSPAGANGVIFTPWLFGERSPINNPSLRGQFFNLGMNVNKGDMYRAVFEGVAYNLLWGLKYVEKISRKKVKKSENEVRFIGGAGKSDVWAQVFADVLQREIVQMSNPQLVGAIGAATIGWVGLGVYNDFTEVNKLVKINKIYKPNSDLAKVYEKIFKNYQKLYTQNRKIFEKLNTLQ